VLDHADWPPLAAIGGSIIDSAGLENVGHAEVDSFSRFPSFEPCEGERCQRGYSLGSVVGPVARLPIGLATDINE
jgi:hypothetical protein